VVASAALPLGAARGDPLDTSCNDATGSSAVTVLRVLTVQRLPFPRAGTGKRCAPVQVNEHVRPFTVCNVKLIIIIIRDHKQGTCMLIDVAITRYRNFIKNRAKNILKYEDLIIEIQRMCNVKEKVIPVITGATGIISKSLRQYMSNLPGEHEIKGLQQTAILGTAHKLRKVLM
jgi:hypothetical protein